MTTGDEAVEQAARKLDELADRSAGGDGVKGRLADELADDAAFLRRLKPSLIAARIRGRLPTDADPGSGPRRAPSGPQLGPPSSGGKSGGPNPIVVVAAMAAAGVLVAKIVDWRGHAHPRR